MKMMKTIFFLPVIIILTRIFDMNPQDAVMKKPRLETGDYYLNQPYEDSLVGNNAKSTIQQHIKQTETKKFMTTTAELLEHSLLVIWNDRDAERRLEEMKKTYAPDVHFYEFNSKEAMVGFKAINDLISKLQKEWPPESRFELNKPSDVNHQIQIATWTLGPQGKPPVATGMDVAVVENDLIKSFYLFLDPPEKSK